MKRLSNLLFYPALCTGVLYALYLWFSGEPFGAGEFVFEPDRYAWTDAFFKIILLLVAIAYALNTVDRYSGLMFFSRIKQDPKLLIESKLGGPSMRWSAMTFGIGIPLALLCGGFLIIADPYSMALGWVVFAGGIEKLVYYIFCRTSQKFRVALTKNSIVINNGGLQILPFGGLRSVESKYDEWLFRYADGRIRSVYNHLPEGEHQKEFTDLFELVMKEKGIPVSLKH